MDVIVCKHTRHLKYYHTPGTTLHCFTCTDVQSTFTATHLCCNLEESLYSFFAYEKYLQSHWEVLINFLETHCCVCPRSNSLLCICAAMVSPVWLGHMICRPLRAHYLKTATLFCNNTDIIYRTLTFHTPKCLVYGL